MTQPNESAFPIKDVQYGLTKREYFAAMAMQGLATQGFELSISKQSESIGSNSSEAIATYAVDLADALITTLNTH